jgi:Zn-dependent protease
MSISSDRTGCFGYLGKGPLLKSGVRVATVRGIEIRIHLTLAIAVLWAIWYWGISMREGFHGAVFGIFILLEVFICVLGHELAHAFVALRYGLVVHDITLLPIGGVARIEHAPIPPRREAMIALAGPILNLVVAGGLLPLVLIVILSRHLFTPSLMLGLVQETGFGGMLIHLLAANIMLAVFNLVPAFPMDGGRVLRAGLSLISNRVVATRIAVTLGQAFAIVLVIGGVYARDVVLPLVAIFIVAAAYVETLVIQVEAKLRNLRVGQFALWDLGGISPDSPLNYAIRGGSRDLAVTQNGVVVGMLWRDDVLAKLGKSHSLRVRDLMDRDVAPMSVDSSVYDVHRRMISTQRPAIPLVEGGVYRGIFTSDRLTHVHRYIHERASGRDRYRGIAVALGLLGR